MGLLGTTTQESYYNISQSTWSTAPNGSQLTFVLTTSYFDPLPTAETQFEVFINDTQITSSNYSYSSPTLTFSSTNYNSAVQATSGAPLAGVTLTIKQIDVGEKYGNYQNISLDDIINNFLVSYVGDGRIIPKVSRALVSFHAQRGLAEMSYDTFRSEKSQEIEVPLTLTMALPHDYVNYVKITWVEGDDGIEHVIYPARKTSNPKALLQDSDYGYIFDNTTGELLTAQDSDTWSKYKNNATEDATDDRQIREDLQDLNLGQRYGIDPQYAQNNGSFFIDPLKGKIYFSSNLSAKTVTLKYISDSLGTDAEMIVHKFAEEAMYKYIAYAVLATSANVPPVIVAQFKKERFAETRKAKLRLSNLKIEELAQVMRGKSKHIKH
jgi:hypothetical protein